MLDKSFLKKILVKIVLHTIFWSIILLFYIYFFGFNDKSLNYVVSFSLFLMPITIATTYVFNYKIIPDYLIKKKYNYFILYSLYAVIISAYLIVCSIFYGLIYLSKFDYGNMPPVSRSLLFVMVAVYLVVIIVCAFKLLKLNLKQAEKTKQLETKILEAQLKLKEQELSYLKMQIHPHFLFNTLNTIYGFALKKNENAPAMILKLSNLLDYLLYQIDKPFVLLEDDLNHIKDYIGLEKMRFNETLNISFETNNIQKDAKIAPMLLLPFVENSFKHGVLIDGMLAITIQLYCKDNSIHFSIENSSSKNGDETKGIGLENLKKRLDILYTDTHHLEIEKSNNKFKVTLSLKYN